MSAVSIADQDQAKYLATNPVVQRLIGRWLGELASLVAANVPTATPLLDAGAGADHVRLGGSNDPYWANAEYGQSALFFPPGAFDDDDGTIRVG